MNKLLKLTMLVILSFPLKGITQDFGRAEYFFDNDPGAGNGNSLTLSSTATPLVFTSSIPTTSLSPGFHHVGIRVKEAGGPWGIFESRGFYISLATASTSDISAAEYFFDSDPGKGNGVPIAVTPGATTNFTVSLPTTLPPGFHFLAIRVRGSDNRWGLFESRGFYISSETSDAVDIISAEYFFDADPGLGNGTAIAVTPGSAISFTVSVPTGLSPGFHFLAIRTKGSDNLWGLFEARGFYVSASSADASDIVAAEYFFDTDPGTGSGTSLSIPSGTASIFTVNLPATGLAPGFHFLSIRTQGSDGKWGLFETRGFYVGTQTTDSPDIVAAEYFFDADPGEGNGLAVSIDTPGDTVNQTFLVNIPTSFPVGPHSVSVRVQTTDGKWSIIETDSINVISNLLPIADAGDDQILGTPLNSASLNGNTSNDPDGTIDSYLWIKVSGPTNGTITNATQATATVEDLEEGTYGFELTVTDNNGTIDKDTVFITVITGPNQSPFANAGPDQKITLPVNSATLDATASTDPDGTIASFEWVIISGPSGSATITDPAQSVTSVTSLGEGVYTLEVTVTDNDGAADKDTLQVIVTDNQTPVADAGADQVITLPVNSVSLNGSASNDADGTIIIFLWTKINGPDAGTITDPGQSTISITDLTAGIYQFELMVTDDNGATNKDTVQIIVNPSNQLPVANAGIDQVITLPVINITLNGSFSSDSDGSLVTYSWTNISGPASATIVNPDQSTTSVIDLTEGTYEFELVVTDNANGTDSDTVQITVNPPLSTCPPVPVITQLGNQLVCNPGGVAYQWYNDGTPVEGENNQIYEISVIEYGLYAVEVTANGCTTRSADFVFLITEAEKTIYSIRLYPNPATDKVMIETPPDFSSAGISLRDALGREVFTSTITSGVNVIRTTDLSAGIYYMYIGGKGGYKIQKL